ncbi:hypothetical protein ABZO31_02135 [Streptomyces sp. HUAS MG47]|uniref:hypothetical protein n=1 Tax=Streptomyces solicamelliae TaxID=3231716 RepID=UPI003877FB35
MRPRQHAPGRRARSKGLAVAGALLLAVGTAAGPDAMRAAAAPAALDASFRPSTTPMTVTIKRMVATSLTVRKNVTITLADGSTRTTTEYTFTKLDIREHMHVVQAANGHTLTIDVPDTGSLGGYDTAGRPETTTMWGDIDNICVRVLLKICNVQGLLDFFGSIIPLTAGAEDFSGRIYAIRTIDDHAELDSTDNPVHLPGTITVSTP